ncbi:MAG: hypothetical protein ABIR32_02900 [Ilumatobacteraceae bacterium]
MTDSISPLTGGAESGDTRVTGLGAQGRVAAVHVETRRGLMVASGFVAAAAVVGLARVGDGWWMPLHLFAVGGLLSAISATTLMLTVTWSTGPAPRSSVAGAQRWALAAGAVAMVVGHTNNLTWMFVGGAAIVVIAILALAMMLVWVRRQAVTNRFSPAIESYAAAVVAGAVGMSVGIVLGTGRAGIRAGDLRDVHLIINIFGLIGLAIAGTLPYFAATQVRTKMSRWATPRAMRATLLALAAATAVAAAGEFWDSPRIVGFGLVSYALGLLSVVAMLPIYKVSRLTWGGPRVLQLLSGIAWWVAMTIALAVARLNGDDDRVILQGLVVGGFAQILVASLAYLGPVLRGGGHRRLTAGFAITRSWISLVAGNAAALGALVGRASIFVVALTVWFVDTAVRAVRLVSAPRSDAHV